MHMPAFNLYTMAYEMYVSMCDTYLLQNTGTTAYKLLICFSLLDSDYKF